MSEITLSERMTSLKSELELAYPDRVVTRTFKDFADRDRNLLSQGIYTLISQGEDGYDNLNGREAMDGTHRILLSAQIELPEESSGELIEETEFVMIEEIKAFMRALPASLCCLTMTGFNQSGQLDAPYGWALITLEWRQ